VLRTCSAEDLIVHKAFAARPQVWVNIEEVILKQRRVLLWGRSVRKLARLASLKGEPELMDELERAGNRAAQVIGPFPRGLVSSPHGRLASSPCRSLPHRA
jgi:hypothetical protein